MQPGNGTGNGCFHRPVAGGIHPEPSRGRHHLDPSLAQRAVQAAGISKPATCHTFRHSFATHLLGHSDVKTPMIYTHVLNRGPSGVRSPAELL